MHVQVRAQCAQPRLLRPSGFCAWRKKKESGVIERMTTKQIGTAAGATGEDRPDRTDRRDHVGVLAKALRLIEAFDAAHVRMTSSEAARRTGTTPAAARRCLLTLCELGYAQTDGKRFSLSHGMLRLSYAYASSTRLPRLLQPALDTLSERTRESASLSVLHQAQVRVAARSTARRSMTVGLGVGSRLPLACSASGRVLMAAQPPDEREALLRSCLPLQALTPHTLTDPVRLRRLLRRVAEQGHALCDEELEPGVRSIAVPLHDGQGRLVGALALASRADRMTCIEMVEQLLPAMLRTQAMVARQLGGVGAEMGPPPGLT